MALNPGLGVCKRDSVGLTHQTPISPSFSGPLMTAALRHLLYLMLLSSQTEKKWVAGGRTLTISFWKIPNREETRYAVLTITVYLLLGRCITFPGFATPYLSISYIRGKGVDTVKGSAMSTTYRSLKTESGVTRADGCVPIPHPSHLGKKKNKTHQTKKAVVCYSKFLSSNQPGRGPGISNSI